MAAKTIGGLVAAGSVALANQVAVWNGSTTLRATLTQLQELIDSVAVAPWSSWTSKNAASGNVTVADNDPVVVGVVNHTVARTVTFPTAPTRARAWFVTNHGTATLTLQPAAIPLVAGHSIWLAWNGSTWGWSAAGSNQGYVGDLQAPLDINGQIARGNLAATGTVTGTMTAAGHSGRVLRTTGNVLVPQTAGFNVTLIAGGAHGVTFGTTTCPAMSAGDIMSIVVDDVPAIHASLLPAASKVVWS